MKLAFCLFNYFPYGGLQRDFLHVARELAARGASIYVYTMAWEGPLEMDWHIQVVPISARRNHTRIAEFVDKVGLMLAREKFDAVIGFNKMPHLDIYYAADVCYQDRAKRLRPKFYQYTSRYKHFTAQEAAVFEHGRSTQILLIAAKQQSLFRQYYGTEEARFHLLPPGIARDRIAPSNAPEIRASTRASLQLQDQDLILLLAGSGFKTKGLDRILKALANLPPTIKSKCHLLVVGDGDAKRFRQQAKRLQIADRVKFLGGQDNIRSFYLASDLLVHPAYHENTGTVLLEAMLAGLPVLTVDVCGYANYVAAANAGVVLPSPFSQQAFTDQVADMLQNPLRQQWQENGLALAKNEILFSRDAKAAEIIIRRAQSKPVFKPAIKFDDYFKLQGKVFRQAPGRLTERVEIEGDIYFLKKHYGVGWREVFKNLIQGRLPIIGAENEWRALHALEAIGVPAPKPIDFAKRGESIARQESYILMSEIAPTMQLDHFVQRWRTYVPGFKLKQAVIQEVAKFAQRLHDNGINHRDFYICHFLVDVSIGISNIKSDNLKLFLIDLHRAQIRTATPSRWLIKDLAGLYFSSKDASLTKRDYFRFIKRYHQQPLRTILKTQTALWQAVQRRGEKLYLEHSTGI